MLSKLSVLKPHCMPGCSLWLLLVPSSKWFIYCQWQTFDGFYCQVSYAVLLTVSSSQIIVAFDQISPFKRDLATLIVVALVHVSGENLRSDFNSQNQLGSSFFLPSLCIAEMNCIFQAFFRQFKRTVRSLGLSDSWALHSHCQLWKIILLLQLCPRKVRW